MIVGAAKTGSIGDGKVFVLPIGEVIRIGRGKGRVGGREHAAPGHSFEIWGAHGSPQPPQRGTKCEPPNC